jgi:hypothetical protein
MLPENAQIVSLDELPGYVDRMLKAQTTGRIVVGF